MRGLDSQQPPFLDTLLLTSTGLSGQGPSRRERGQRPSSPHLPPWGQSFCFPALQGESSQREIPRRPPTTPTFSLPHLFSPGAVNRGPYLRLRCCCIEAKELPGPVGQRRGPKVTLKAWEGGQSHNPLALPCRPEHEVVHSADLELVPGVDWRQGGHIHVEELDLRLVLGRGLTQRSLHFLVEVLALKPMTQSRVGM